MKPGTLSLSQAAFLALTLGPALIGSGLAYSGDVFLYKDLLAQPQYDVNLLDQFMPLSAVDPEQLQYGNSHRQQSPEHAPRIETMADKEKQRLTQEGQQQHSVPQHQPDSSHNNNMIMTSNDGQRWSCIIPPKPVVKEEESPKKSPQQLAEENEQNVKRGLELLEPLSTGNCLFSTINFWTYEYCYKKHVRQYHIVNNNGKYQIDPTQPLHYLGKFEPPTTEEIQGNTESSSSSPSSSSTNHQNSLSKQSSGTNTDLAIDHDKKYLIQKWEDGSHCPLVGKQRRIEIQYQCAPIASDQIYSVSEPSTCSYVMVINSPRLCKDAAFEREEAPEANKIDCRPLVSDEQYQRIMSTAAIASSGTIDDGVGVGEIIIKKKANEVPNPRGKEQAQEQEQEQQQEQEEKQGKNKLESEMLILAEAAALLQEIETLKNDLEMGKNEQAIRMVQLLHKHQKLLAPLLTDADRASLKNFNDNYDMKNQQIKFRNGRADHHQDTVVYLKSALSGKKDVDGEKDQEGGAGGAGGQEKPPSLDLEAVRSEVEKILFGEEVVVVDNLDLDDLLLKSSKFVFEEGGEEEHDDKKKKKKAT